MIITVYWLKRSYRGNNIRTYTLRDRHMKRSKYIRHIEQSESEHIQQSENVGHIRHSENNRHINQDKSDRNKSFGYTLRGLYLIFPCRFSIRVKTVHILYLHIQTTFVLYYNSCFSMCRCDYKLAFNILQTYADLCSYVRCGATNLAINGGHF